MSDVSIVDGTKNHINSSTKNENHISLIADDNINPQLMFPKSIIGKNVYIKGTLSAKEDLIFNGRLEGTITLLNNVLEIGDTGKIEANLYAKIIIINGELKGDVHATEKVIIKKSGRITGDIYSSDISVENGSVLQGNIDMDKNDISQSMTIIQDDVTNGNNRTHSSSFLDKVLELTHLHSAHREYEIKENDLQLKKLIPKIDPSIQYNTINPFFSFSDKSFMGESVVLKGDLNAEEDVVFHGKLDGIIHSKNTIELGINAKINANCFVNSIVAYSEIKGDIYATDQVIIKKGARILGNIYAQGLTMESGALLMGKLNMMKNDIEKIDDQIS